MDITKENYFLLKEQGFTRAKIAEQFSLTDGQIKKVISKMGWSKPLPSIANFSAFSTYTEESCYWAGFLAADGNVDSKKRIRIMLNYDDISHLEKFKQFLKSTHTVSYNIEKYYRCSFEFTHKDMCEDLENNFLIIPEKTDKLEFPVEQIPYQLLKHYVRGYFDGDGSICESFSNKNSCTSSIYATFCSGSTNFSKDLFEFLQIELGLGGHLQEFERKHQLKFNTNDAKILTNWMYENSKVYLDRKYMLYQRLVVDNIRTTRSLDKGIVQS